MKRGFQGRFDSRGAALEFASDSHPAWSKPVKGFRLLLRRPAPLAAMADPDDSNPWATILKANGFRHVVCLCDDKICYEPAPLKVLFVEQLEDLCGGDAPSDPEADRGIVERAARAAFERLLAGEGVAVHCVGGRGRTGTVLGRILRMLDVDADQAINRLRMLYANRGWPESPWQEHVVRESVTSAVTGDR